jgi:hypothetical protein
MSISYANEKLLGLRLDGATLCSVTV